MSVLKVCFYKTLYASCLFSLPLFPTTLRPKKGRIPLLSPHQKSRWKYQMMTLPKLLISTFTRLLSKMSLNPNLL